MNMDPKQTLFFLINHPVVSRCMWSFFHVLFVLLIGPQRENRRLNGPRPQTAVLPSRLEDALHFVEATSRHPSRHQLEEDHSKTEDILR